MFVYYQYITCTALLFLCRKPIKFKFQTYFIECSIIGACLIAASTPSILWGLKNMNIDMNAHVN